MATILDSLAAGVSTGSLDQQIGGQVAKLQQAAGAVAGLINDPPDGVAEFIARIASLSPPPLPTGGSLAMAIGSAGAALPKDLSAFTAGATGNLASFATLVQDQLSPLLEKAVAVARAVEGLSSLDFRCAAASTTPVVPPPTPPAPGTPPPSAGSNRLQAVSTRLQAVDQLMDAMPSPLTAGALLDRLLTLGGNFDHNLVAAPMIPLLDDVLQPLQTVSLWSGMSPADVGTHLLASVEALTDRLNTAGPAKMATALGPAIALAAPMQGGDIATFATLYLARAKDIADALTANDMAAAATQAAALNTAIADWETLRTALEPVFTSEVRAATVSLTAAPEETLSRLLHIVVQLEPLDPGAMLVGLPRPPAASAAEVQAFRESLAPVIDFIEDLTGFLDISAIGGPVATVATEAQQIADSVSQALANIAIEVRAAFHEMEEAIEGVGLDEMEAQLRTGIATAGTAVRDGIATAFGPMRDGIAAAVQVLSDALAAVDLTAVTQALTEVVNAIAAVLQDPAIGGAVADLRAALDEVADTLTNLSFTPVTDEVVKLIEDMTDGLRALSNTELNDAIKGLLETALQVLPPDLRPAIDPVIDDFGQLIDEGPVTLLVAVRAKPQEVLDHVRDFEPGKLIGETLGGPYREMLAKVEGFRPSSLLDGVEEELDRQKRRLTDTLKPSKALEPLLGAFDGLLAQLDGFSPAAVIAPFEAEVEKAIADAIAASPVDELFDEIDGVFATIQSVLDTVTQINESIGRFTTALVALADSNAQLDAWRDAALAKLDTLPNAAAMDTALGALRDIIDQTRHADLLTQYDTLMAPVLAALAPIDAPGRLVAIIDARQRLKPLAAALPTGATRDAINAVINRFDPLDPVQTGALRAAAEMAQAASASRQALASLDSQWALLLHGTEGGLAELRSNATGATALHALVTPELDKALLPVRMLFERLSGMAAPVGALAQTVADLETRLTATLGNILTGPSSLQAITDAVQQVVDTLRHIDLGFLRDAIDGAFRTLRGNIEALSPRPLAIALDAEFAAIIDAIDLSAVLPAAEIEALDTAYDGMADTLRGLDPQKLVTDIVQPVFDETVTPLIDALDFTPVFDALITALQGLDEELKTEFGRVNTAYQALLASRPDGVGGSVAVG